ncbi:DUF11 domain-containing protein [Nonomuraea jiangxiensis]|uniref:Conserved repeat domain-containing protein n=1 Tax=Nonomuraea jiangxiensis TaxID=633440 RepID=A0A1G8BT20_9ACTN|nr:DUF11 domain-containing protein [Nonomuraea jiangxiensis]SDH36248.1 conserved repeat domain-containing protein [Nonomuraea jiangxiensis]
MLGLAAAVLLAAASVLAVVTPAHAASVTVTDSADPVTVGTSYTYTVAYDGFQLWDGAITLSGASASVTSVATSNPALSCHAATSTYVPCTASPFINTPGTITLTVSPAAAGTVTATARLANCCTDYYGSQSTTINTPGTDLAVSVADSADPVNLGTTFTDTITVTNNGPTAATGVTATLALTGASATIVSATPSQGSCTVTSSLSCSLGSLAGSDSATIDVVISPAATGTVIATGGVDGNEPDPTSANDSDAENTTVQAADIDVDLGAQPHLGILVPYLSYTMTADNTGPDAVISATLTATLPAGKTATNLSSGCTSVPGSVTCIYGAIASGAGASKTFQLPLNLLSLGQVNVTATRTISAPGDPNPVNDSAAAACTVISVILATCP